MRQASSDAITERGVRLDSYIGETALRAGIGSPGVMKRQLQFLLEESDRDNVEVRIVPLSAPWHPAPDGSFTFLETDGKAVVHVENRISGLFLYNDPQVEVYRRGLDKMKEVAMSPADSKGLIANVINEDKTGTTV